MAARRPPAHAGEVVTHRFRLATAGCPARVWAALVSPGSLYGVSAMSTWVAGATVEFICGGPAHATGRVLHASEPGRLTFSLDDPSGEATFVTWEVRAGSAGSVVRLYVDETSPTPEADAEDVWLPILSRLGDLARV